ncbi:MAG TPA: hypothetical protein VE755_07590 [Myxococcales bacterium]|nr:hypothetical protein [Myxococcales bacterium]
MSVMPDEARIDDQVAIDVERRLVAIAQKFDASLRDRVTLLLMAAAEAILKLAEVDLVRYEAEQGGHTLALWEEMAPVTSITVQHVNELIAGATAQFPPPPEDESAGDLDAAFGPDTGEAAEEPAPRSTAEQIASLVAAVCSGMRRDVTRLGDRLRNPTVMRDPWMLIQDLLEFRGRVRVALGELIYQVCSFIAEVERDTIIPGYVQELEYSLLVRSATTNLAFLFRGHAKRIAGAADEKVPAALQDALKDVHAFSRTRALPHLRTSDKRIFLETRANLYTLSQTSPAPAQEIRQAVENMARFLDSMSVVSRRENLRSHDRAQLARAGRHLEAAQVNLGSAEVARREVADAVRAASALYGRDAQLDAYLRAQRHFPADWLSEPELALEIARLSALLGGVTPP